MFYFKNFIAIIIRAEKYGQPGLGKESIISEGNLTNLLQNTGRVLE